MNEIERPATFIAAEALGASVRGPFVGTRPFSGEDAAFFFGREREATRLANLIGANTLTVLYGDSGVGKSSLINARLPLALDELEPDWLIISFQEWQVGCEKRLEGEIADKTGNPITDGLAKTLLTFADKTGRPVLLALDQFEEYFAYHPDGISSLDAELAKLINRRDSPVRVLLSLRSDGLFLLDRLRLRVPNIFGSMMLIEALDDKAAADCVLLPLKAYNNQPGTAPVQMPEQELVDALIGGSDEELILLRLPGRGRSELEKGDRRRVRIVAPFLQMALDMLWQEDVVDSGCDCLQLSTLRRLAELEQGEPSSDAVGAIAQRYVDSILRDFSDEEKRVCAVILERMVLPSGQKVAVKILDLDSVLTEAERGQAVLILERLSSDQSKRLIKMVAGVRDSERHYQIVHDAMAIPLLGWVEQWKSEERAARARREAEEKAELEKVAAEARAGRRTKVFGLLALAAVILPFFGMILGQYLDARSKFEKLTSFAKNDPRPGFRLPLLFGLAAADEAGWWPLNKVELEKVLRGRLLRSPRDGGTFSAVGFDPNRNTIALVDKDMLIVCRLGETRDCDVPSGPTPGESSSGSKYTLRLPTKWGDESVINARLGQPFSSVGFVTGLDQPVMYRRGLIHRWKNGEWVSLDLGSLLPDFPGSIFVEILDGGLKITFNDWPNSRMWAIRLVFDPRSEKWTATAPDKTLEVTWRPGSPSPVISANSANAAFIYFDAADGGGLQSLLNVVSARQTEVSQSQIRLETISPSSGRPSSVQSLVPAGTRPALGFTVDNRFLAVLYRSSMGARQAKLFDLSQHPVIEQTGFELDMRIEILPPQGNQWSFAPVTAAKIQEQSGYTLETWRFAWLTRRGVRLVEGESGRFLFETEKQVLPAGLDNASRLDFSADGAFLVLQSQNVERRDVSVRVWDLGPAWRNLVENETKTFVMLRELACRVARLDADHYSEAETFEMNQWEIHARPCQPEVTRGRGDSRRQ